MEKFIVNAYSLSVVEVFALVIMAFGLLIIALAAHRRKLRSEISGIRSVVATDRARFGKGTLRLMLRCGIAMMILGAVTFTVLTIIKHPVTIPIS